jgi:uncharacterized protein (TIGR00369 family)
MSNKKREEIEKPEGHFCFACGTANPIGLNMQFYREDDTVCCEITLGRYHGGWENMAHGGVITTLLDEVMSWAILYFKRTFFVTRKIEVKYVRPVLIGTPLTARGRVMDASEAPRIMTKGEIRDDQGRLLVRSQGEFVELSKEDLSSVPEGMKKEMLSLFERFS